MTSPACQAGRDIWVERLALVILLVLLAVWTSCSGDSAPDSSYDLVILNGRVMDPETGRDETAHVGIRGTEIASISQTPIRGERSIDAEGLIVAPGFIDLHSHGQTHENYRLKAMDGVTTALELEVGVRGIDAWYAARTGNALIHFGASAGHIPHRMRVMKDPGTFLPSGDAAHRQATEEETREIIGGIRQDLEAGAAGVGLGIQCTPGAVREEILRVFRVAAEFGAACYVHLRYMGANDPHDAPAALEEVLEASSQSSAPLHVVHIHSSGLRATPDLLDRIAEAKAQGTDVTTEVYPYSAAMTRLDSALFDKGWQDTLEIGYSELLWVETGERLTEQTFQRYRKQGGMVIIFMIPDEIANLAVVSPHTIIASDGVIESGKGHPRGAGTFSRVLGRYVRDQGQLSWMDALRKMTLAPAQRLEGHVPAMARKGRLQGGADADITVFNPQSVIDRATFENPSAHSEGIEYVLVNGTPVVLQGRIQESVRPGVPVRAPLPGTTVRSRGTAEGNSSGRPQDTQ